MDRWAWHNDDALSLKDAVDFLFEVVLTSLGHNDVDEQMLIALGIDPSDSSNISIERIITNAMIVACWYPASMKENRLVDRLQQFDQKERSRGRDPLLTTGLAAHLVYELCRETYASSYAYGEIKGLRAVTWALTFLDGESQRAVLVKSIKEDPKNGGHIAWKFVKNLQRTRPALVAQVLTDIREILPELDVRSDKRNVSWETAIAEARDRKEELIKKNPYEAFLFFEQNETDESWDIHPENIASAAKAYLKESSTVETVPPRMNEVMEQLHAEERLSRGYFEYKRLLAEKSPSRKNLLSRIEEQQPLGGRDIERIYNRWIKNRIHSGQLERESEIAKFSNWEGLMLPEGSTLRVDLGTTSLIYKKEDLERLISELGEYFTYPREITPREERDLPSSYFPGRDYDTKAWKRIAKALRRRMENVWCRRLIPEVYRKYHFRPATSERGRAGYLDDVEITVTAQEAELIVQIHDIPRSPVDAEGALAHTHQERFAWFHRRPLVENEPPRQVHTFDLPNDISDKELIFLPQVSKPEQWAHKYLGSFLIPCNTDAICAHIRRVMGASLEAEGGLREICGDLNESSVITEIEKTVVKLDGSNYISSGKGHAYAHVWAVDVQNKIIRIQSPSIEIEINRTIDPEVSRRQSEALAAKADQARRPFGPNVVMHNGLASVSPEVSATILAKVNPKLAAAARPFGITPDYERAELRTFGQPVRRSFS